MRVYLPATPTVLRGWLDRGVLGPVPLTGYAVTPGLRAWYDGADEEELEYAATSRAARAALRLLTGVPADAVPRRVVVALDAAAVEVRDDLDEGAVRITVAPPWSAVAAALVDEPAAAVVVAAAASAVDAADLGALDAEHVVGEAEDRELLWFATQEIAGLGL